MPSPATRSSRLTKSKQSEVEDGEKESKDTVNKTSKKALLTPKAPATMPNRTSVRKSSGNKSPIASQESGESESSKKTTRSKRNANQDESVEKASPKKVAAETRKEKAVEIESSTSTKPVRSKISTLDISVKLNKDTKKSDGDLKKSTSTSTPTPTSTPAIRKSRRAPVPSSRFKDMEMALTPNSQKAKRSLAVSSPADTDSVTEPSPKRIRMNSNKSVESLADDGDTECPHPSPKVDKGVVDSDSHNSRISQNSQIGIESAVKEIVEEPTVILEKDISSIERENEIISCGGTKIMKDMSEKKDAEVSVRSLSDGESTNENMEQRPEGKEVTEKDPLIELSTDGNMKDVIVNAIVDEGTSDKKDEKSNICDQNEFVSPEVSLNTDDTPEPMQQEVSVEEVGLSCQDGGLIVEETVHTYMDEKDVVIQNTGLESIEETSDVSQAPKKIELSFDSDTTSALSTSLMLKGQEVTVQERDGKMVAIVKIPGTLSNIQNTPSHTETEKQTEESFLHSSNSKHVLTASGSTPKSRHGYILNKKPEKQAFVTISDQDQNTINISVEPTTMSSLLKPKAPESATKTAQKSLYGRVIKQDGGTAKTNTGVSPVVQNTPPSTSLLIKKPGSNQKISLLPQSIKATNPKDCKPYSLLSSPSELLQKLKGEFEKKQTSGTVIHEQVQKTTQLPSSSKKVVIITHPSTSGVEKSSTDSSLLKEDESSIIESDNVGSSEQIKTESTVIVTDSESQPDTIPSQDTLTEVSTMDVVEETPSVPCKVEEMVTSSSLPVGDATEQQEASETSPGEVIESASSEVKADDGESGHGLSDEEYNKNKELIIDPADAFSQSVECEGVISGDLLISNEVDKSTVEETVITSSTEGEIELKQEIDTESDVLKGHEKSDEHQTASGKKDAQGSKTQRIKLVDNGIVYELQIVSDGETRALQVQDGGIEFEGMNEEEGVVVKQEIVDEDGNTSTDTLGKSTLGTQTVYASKRGRPRASSDKDDTDAPVHKLATIVQEGGQKKHFYYVSVVPGKTMDGKYRRSVEHILPGCVVSDSGEYCCKECDYRTDKKANFYKHRRLHTGSKPHVCQVCKYQARTSSNLKRHMGIHEDIREFKCTQCALSFRQKIHLERHIRYRHEEKRVKCPMCDYVCANEQPDLKMHIKRKHTQESGKVFTCPQCNIEVGSKRDLKQHLKFHKDGPELKLFCKECSFVTDCKSRLQRHLVVHSNVKPYHCGVCDYKATQKEHVVRHLRSQHKIEVNKPKRPWKKQSKQEAGTTLGGNSRGDFTCGDKIFACNHCSMRFAKLINLYKHLHTQHTDIMPAESESNYYCVVCEFSTSSKKNLLIHMRRHNMTDQTPPTHVYSCVLCRYVNPRRRNLFQHMRKKHNIDISTQVDIAGMTAEEEAAVRQDGGDKIAEFIQTEQGVFTQANSEEIATTSSFESVDGSSQVIKDNLAGVANMIKIEDLTRVTTGADGKDSTTSLVIDNGDGTQLIQAASLMQHKAADAIEGLQALAGQAGLIIDEEVTAIETKPSIIIEQSEVGVMNTTDATLADGNSIILSADQSIVEEQVATIEEASSEQIQHIVESVESADADAGLTSLELTEEQLSSLQHGDIVQMEGQVYMVELVQDPDSLDKQLLSFLPINQG